MKKYILIALVSGLVSSLQAAPDGSSTMAEFIATQKANAKEKGWKFNQETVEKRFTEIDVNGDGVASGDEKKAYWSKDKDKAAAKPEAAKAAAPKVKLKNGDSDMEHYVEMQKKRWESNGWRWNLAKVEEEFNAIDVNKDGIATGLEKKEYWAKKSGKK